MEAMNQPTDFTTDEKFQKWVDSLQDDQVCATGHACPVSYYLESINPDWGYKNIAVRYGHIVFNALVNVGGSYRSLSGAIALFPRIVDDYVFAKQRASEYPENMGWNILTPALIKTFWDNAKSKYAAGGSPQP